MSVYEEFAKSIPGFLPPEATGAPEPFPKPLQEQISGIFGSSPQDLNVSFYLRYRIPFPFVCLKKSHTHSFVLAKFVARATMILPFDCLYPTKNLMPV